MRQIVAIVVLLVAAPAFGQSRLYTNADLGKPVKSDARLSPADAAAILAPYAFKDVPTPPHESGSRVYVLPHDPDWPFRTSTREDIGRPLDPWWVPPIYPFSYEQFWYAGPQHPFTPRVQPRRQPAPTPLAIPSPPSVTSPPVSLWQIGVRRPRG